MKEIDELHRRFLKICFILSIILGSLVCLDLYLEYNENNVLKPRYIDDGRI